MNQQTQSTQTETLDPQAVNLAKAIRQTESGGNFAARGKSGEYGAYQYTPDTWNKDAMAAGVNVPLEQATPQQQNEVAYKKIKSLKDAGHNVGEIASIWNSGDPQAYLSGKTGTNSYGVKYDVPAYAKSVATAYQSIKNGGNVGVDPSNPSSVQSANINQSDQPEEKSWGEEIGGRINDASQAITKTLSGEINPVSGVIQTVGAVAGGIGDTVNKVLELVPGVKWLEGKIGQGIGALAQTESGQSVLKSIQSFAQEHPELADDIGAGFNIATAIPILRGLGVVKDIGMSGLSLALRGIAEKGLTENIVTDMGRIKSLSRVFAQNGGKDSIKAGLAENLIPDISDGKYANAEVLANASHRIGEIDNTQLQPILDEVSKRQSVGQSLETLKQKAIQAATNDSDLKEAGVVPQAIKQIEKRFDGWKFSFGDNVDAATENKLKRGSSQFSDWGTPEGSADKAIYSTLQQDIEELAQKNGLDDVKAINAKMANLIKYRNMMQALDGKPIKVGLAGKLARKGVSVGAGMLAGNMGGGLIGGLGAGYMADIADKGIMGLGRNVRTSVLNRTVPGAFSKVLKTGSKKIPGLIGGAAAQNAFKSQ